jgi:uncharacterized protein
MLADLTAMKHLLATSRTIAVVGLSPKETRPSNMVARYLIAAGYEVIPVNPGHEQILALPCFASLSEINRPLDIVDIFRRSSEAGPLVDEAIRLGAKAVWLQEGVVDEEAAARAREAGLFVAMDLCLKTMHCQLLGHGAGPAKADNVCMQFFKPK